MSTDRPLARIYRHDDYAAVLHTAIETGDTNLDTAAQVLGPPPRGGQTHPRERAYRALHRLRQIGALAHVCYGRWSITERGRLAVALLRFQAGRHQRRIGVDSR